MITIDQLTEVVLDQQETLLSRDPGVDRIINKPEKVELPPITVITGIRRCGKSTLLSQIIRKSDNFRFINFDDERLVNFELSDFQTLMLVFRKMGEFSFIFLDEIQNIDSWERFVRRIYDEGYHVYITGSNALLLSSELSTLLTGRYIKTELFPFSFQEFLVFHKETKLLPTTKNKAKILNYFDKYLFNGGFPEYLRTGEKEYTKRVYEDIIYKDLIVRFNIRQVKVFRQLVHYLFTNFTSEISYNSLTSVFSVKSVNTIKDYIQYLEEAYLLFVCYKYDYSLKKQYVSNKKIYIIDNGMRSKVTFITGTDKGRLLENMVYIELIRRGYEVYFYKTKNNLEIDFFIPDNNNQLIQVCYDLSQPKTLNREIRALEKANQELGSDNMLILTYNTSQSFVVGKHIIEAVPTWKWIM